MKQEYYIANIDCANCTAKIERKIQQLPEVANASIDFVSKKVKVEWDDSISEVQLLKTMNEIADQIESNTIIRKQIQETSNQRDQLIEIILALILFGLGLLMRESPMKNLVFLASYLLVGTEILAKAGRNLLKGKVFDENFLMSLATLGAIAITYLPDINHLMVTGHTHGSGSGELPEAAMVMILFQLGLFFQSRAVDKSRKAIGQLMDLMPEQATLIQAEGLKTVTVSELRAKDLILVKAGDKIPVDGIVRKGTSNIDKKAITGESRFELVTINQSVVSGSLNVDGVLEIEATVDYNQSTVKKILDLVDEATTHKAKQEQFITRFARYYTPIVVLIAAIIAFIVPLILYQQLRLDYISRALIFLVISCPCALVISVPLSFVAGIGGASKQGILFKGANTLENLSKIRTIAFDKTGTLTNGQFSVVKTEVMMGDEQQLIRLAAYGEYYANHPLAFAILNEYQDVVDESLLSNVQQQAHLGMKVNYQGKMLLVGNRALMKQENIVIPPYLGNDSIVEVAYDGQYQGRIILKDTIRSSAKSLINQLNKQGIKQVMVTGDHSSIAQEVATTLNISDVHANLYPQDKVAVVQQLQQQGPVAFVGDGINDAPVLMTANVGISMGTIGSDAAVEAADLVLVTADLNKIATALKHARKTMSVVKQNIGLTLGIKFIFLLLGAGGYTNMWLAVFADVGVSLIAIANAMRCLVTKSKI